MKISKILKAGLALQPLQDDEYHTNTLALQLKLDSDHNLTGVVTCFSSTTNTTAVKKRSEQVQQALRQEKPTDFLQKATVAEGLLPFVHLGKHLKHRESKPPIACDYGAIANCIVKSIKFNSDTKADGILYEDGMLAVKLENFDLPNESWTLIWGADRKPVPCPFGLRALEKIQMAVSPALMVTLNDVDQEDLEAVLEIEDIEEIVTEYERLNDEMAEKGREAEKMLVAELCDACIELEMEFGDISSPTEKSRNPQDKHHPVEEEAKAAGELILQFPQDSKITPERAMSPPTPPPQLAGSKRQREDSHTPECNDNAKKIKPTPSPPAQQVAGVKRQREENPPRETAKKIRTDVKISEEASSEVKLPTVRAKANPSSGVGDDRPRPVSQQKKPSALKKSDSSAEAAAPRAPASLNKPATQEKTTPITKKSTASTPAVPKKALLKKPVSKKTIPDQAMQSAARGSDATLSKEKKQCVKSQSSRKTVPTNGKPIHLLNPPTSDSERSTATPPPAKKSATRSWNESPELDSKITSHANSNILGKLKAADLRKYLTNSGYKVAKGERAIGEKKGSEMETLVYGLVAERKR